MENLIIRTVRRADLPGLLDMVQALARHHGDDPIATVDTLDRDLLGRDRIARGLVARAGPELLGYAILVPLLRVQYGQRGLDLHHLFVHGPARGKGVGRALINAARHSARAAGASTLSVGTHPDNLAAAQVYLACGFTPVPLSGSRFTVGIEPSGVGFNPPCFAR